MHELLSEIDRQAGKKSILHRVDTRVMIIFVLAVIIYAVLQTDIIKLLIIEAFLLAMMAIALLDPIYLLKRFALIFPFGGFLAIMQPFIREGEVIYSWWVFHITREGFDFGMLLLAKLFVCVSAVILLSSVSSLPQILSGLKKLKVPKFFITTLNMMIRYLYLFYENLHRIRTAQKCRGFSMKRNPAGYRFVLRNVANSISTLFIKSYSQGERVFTCMLARGYTMDTDYIFTEERRLKGTDFALFIGFAVLVLLLEIQRLPFNLFN
ncbi:MAG: cobalt ECF transporter T component CbiQ [Thermoplasmata archaeon]|nr:MAG: cobalt ECF transporter T component CbiQ [Thermoplasmata archaeon]